MATQTLSLPQSRSLRFHVFKLAMPAVGEQFLNMLVGLVDTYLVGHISLAAAARLGYGPAEGLAAVGLAGNLVWMITTLFMAGAVGSTALIARASGAGDREQAHTVVRQSVLLGVAMGLIGMAMMLLFARQSMLMFGAPQEIIPLGESFLHITAFSMPLAGVMFMLNAVLRGVGDTKTPLLVMLLVNALNIAISWLLINGQFGLPTLGVAGAGWGMAIGRVVGGIVAVSVLLRGCGMLKLDRWPRPDIGMLRRILRIGFPAAAETLAFQSALVVFARFITHLGTVPYAAHNIVITVESISFLPGMGFAVAATTLVGQSLGAENKARARHSGNESYFQGAIFMGIMGALFVLFPAQFLALLVDDPAVVAAGIVPLQMVGIVQPILAANFVYAGALRGAGDTRWPLLIKLISPWLIRLPLAFWLIPLYGLNGAWVALCVDLALQGVLAWWRFRGNSWERIRV
ncbi:MAG TPA: MATE family efflux transporter [Herpetosiphonaceae bacterium]